jgi:chemotaxis protein methyltransferase CheR
MSAAFSASELERFRALISKRLGLWFDDGKLEYLAGILERRLEARSEVAALYLANLDATPKTPTELRAIAQELTVGETYFFRHTDQFRAFAEVALPARVEARSTVKQLRFLSAGCSSGEEGYSLSILAKQYLEGASWEVAIKGVDVNPRAVEKARLARYSSWALRETPEDVQKRYFSAEGREFVLSKAIRDTVTFDEENLAGEEVWAAESYDVVFCRNVLMYFTPESAQRVVARFSRALAPGGYLFLGHAENLRGLSADFDLCHTHGTFYYRRKDALGRPATQFSEPALPQAISSARLPDDWTSTWLETVQRSSDRIRVLTEQAPTAAPRASATRAATPRAAALDLSLALELLAHERFAEALDVLSRLPAASAQDADAVLLRAALLTHCGRLDAAELACAELLALDGLSAGAHYLRALCRERQGDTRAAIEHAQTASYLEPAFAMPHLHLGLMARRTGDRATAQRELSQAALLLQREDPSRLLLFGGGFNRDGLIALCRSELGRLGAGT